jgi:cytochrome c oxidase subunit 2
VTTRSAARRAAVRQQKSGLDKARPFIFAAIVVGVLVVGAYLAFGDFLNRGGGATAGAIDVQSSMAGFTPSEIKVKAGTTVTMDWWTQDAAVHLQGGVHTMVSDELGLREELPAESRKAVVWQVPNKPGTYDVWCESCCGGKEAPQMHGKIVIEA